MARRSSSPWPVTVRDCRVHHPLTESASASTRPLSLSVANIARVHHQPGVGKPIRRDGARRVHRARITRIQGGFRPSTWGLTPTGADTTRSADGWNNRVVRRTIRTATRPIMAVFAVSTVFGLGACGGGLSSTSGSITPEIRIALAAWRTFPVRATPRPLLIVDGDNVNAPSMGFRDDADKIAYLAGAMVAPSKFPVGPTSTDGFPLIDAQAAFKTLEGQKTKGPPSTTQLIVTTVTLGTGEFETDRGSRRLPGWLFGFANVQNPAEVLAVAPTRIFNPPASRAQGPVVGSAKLDSDQRTLTVEFAGAPSGSGPCTASYTMNVGASGTAVAVQVHTVTHDSGVACALPAYANHLTTKLAKPLGNRVLVDGASLTPIPVTGSRS